jgi:hypothetical protein
LSFSRLS